MQVLADLIGSARLRAVGKHHTRLGADGGGSTRKGGLHALGPGNVDGGGPGTPAFVTNLMR